MYTEWPNGYNTHCTKAKIDNKKWTTGYLGWEGVKRGKGAHSGLGGLVFCFLRKTHTAKDTHTTRTQTNFISK